MKYLFRTDLAPNRMSQFHSVGKPRRTFWGYMPLRRFVPSRLKFYVDPLATAKKPMVRSTTSVVTMLTILGSQSLLLFSPVLAQPGSPATNPAPWSEKDARAKVKSSEELDTDGIEDQGRNTTPTFPMTPVPSAHLEGCGPDGDCQVTVRALDLKRIPTEKDLRRAGQFGGALNPLRPAEPTRVSARLKVVLQKGGVVGDLNDASATTSVEDVAALQDPETPPTRKLLATARRKLRRTENINVSFGRAMQEWNQHRYQAASLLLAQHVKDYPESPWAGEALLHLGCNAKYNGRFAEAQEIYEKILKSTNANVDNSTAGFRRAQNVRGNVLKAQGSATAASTQLSSPFDVDRLSKALNGATPTDLMTRAVDAADETSDESFDIHQKAKLRWADLDIATGNLDGAVAKLQNLLQTDRDWRRLTWTQAWLRRVTIYRRNARDLRACGTQALSVVFGSLGKKQASLQLAQMRPTSSNGYSLAELQRLASRYGVSMRGFRTDTQSLASLPTPFLIHYDFNEAAIHQNPALWQLPAKNSAKGIKDGKASGTASKRNSQDSLFYLAHRSGHFLVAEQVSPEKATIKLYDPQEKRHYYMAFADLKREWSGTGLVVTKAPLRPDTSIIAHSFGSQDKAIPASSRRLAWLSVKEMSRVVGGCCGIARAIEDLGEKLGINGTIRGIRDWIADPQCSDSFGSPQVTFNRVNLNMFVKDTPLWYQPAIGPSVQITMSYNSQDALNQNTLFGNKWMFNYGSYLVEDTGDGGGVVTLFLPDGNPCNFYPNGKGGYTAPVGVFDQLRKKGPTRYELLSPSGDKCIYDIPAGTDSLQASLIEVQDRWGQSLHMGYAVRGYRVLLTTITDAQGKVTHISYDEAGHIQQVDDPFGRHANFSYDGNGNMVEAVDMEGSAFRYAYNDRVEITRLDTLQGSWLYKHEYPYRNGAGQVVYNAQYYITMTDPKGQVQKLCWDGSLVDRQPVYQIDTKKRRTNFWIDAVIDGKGVITSIDHPDGDTEQFTYDRNTGCLVALTNARGRSTNYTYNNMGAVTSDTDYKGQTTRYYYDRNGWDLLSVKDAFGQTVATCQYNAQHLPTLVNDNNGGSTQISYTPWGGLLSTTTTANSESHTLTNVYDAVTGQVASISRDGVLQATYAYDEVGRVSVTTDVATNTSLAYAYDDLDRVTKITYPDSTYIAIEYACCGMPGVMRDRAGRKTYLDYDELKRPVRLQDAMGQSVSLDYDLAGNVSQVTDTAGRETSFVYDGSDRLIRKTYPDGTSEENSYDKTNNVLVHRTARGKVTRIFSDENSNVTRVDYPSDPDVTIKYDSLNRPYEMTDATGTSRFGYDQLGYLTSVDGPFANDVVTYAYDGRGRRTGVQIDNATLMNASYDAKGRLAQLTSIAGVFTPTYIGDSDLISSVMLPNQTHTSYGYDALLRLTDLQNATSTNGNISQYTYGYEATGYEHRDMLTSILSQVEANPAQGTNFGYSGGNQLTSEVTAEGGQTVRSRTYGLDAMNNRIIGQSVDSSFSSQFTYAINALNQTIATQGTITNSNQGTTTNVATQLRYDASGNQTAVVSGQGGAQYTYDDADRLISVVTLSQETGAKQHKSEFVHDGAGRVRIDREYTWNSINNSWQPQKETRYIFDGMDVVQERDGQNHIVATYTRAGNIGGVLARTVPQTNGPAQSYYYHYDGRGNVVQLTDANQQVVARYAYDAFGGELSRNGPQSDQPFRYQSKIWRAGLYDFGLRFYNPGMGRWLTRDPLREIYGGLNLYSYCAQNPLALTDEYGLCITNAEKALLFVAGVAVAIVAPGVALEYILFAGVAASVSGGVHAYNNGGNTSAIAKGAFVGGMEGMASMASGIEAGYILAPAVAAGAGLLNRPSNNNCFVAGTPVLMADGTTKPIEQVKAGDYVLSRDIATDKTEAKSVKRTFQNHTLATLVLTFSDGTHVETTPGHPFYVDGQGFMLAGELGIGTSIVTRAGPSVQLTSIERHNLPATIYNFEVEDTHTYFVGEVGLWVHNQSYLTKRADAAADRHGGEAGGPIVDRNGVVVPDQYTFPNRRSAIRAGTEIAGDLGSDAIPFRARDFRGGSDWMTREKMVGGEKVIGSPMRMGSMNTEYARDKNTLNGGIHWADHFTGHPRYGDGPHVNVYIAGRNFHLWYPETR